MIILYVITQFLGIEFITDANIFESFQDNFMKRLNTPNLRARGVKTIKDYYNNLSSSICIPTLFEKYIIAYNIYKIYLKIDKLDCSWVHLKKFKSLQWKIVLTDDKCENGLPHTRCDTIILSRKSLNRPDFESVLFHEQLHVYQKIFPKYINRYIYKNFIVVGKQDYLHRVNPDTDDNVYKNKNNNIMFCTFNSEYPENLLDVNYSMVKPKYEHPLEQSVYECVENYVQIA